MLQPTQDLPLINVATYRPDICRPVIATTPVQEEIDFIAVLHSVFVINDQSFDGRSLTNYSLTTLCNLYSYRVWKSQKRDFFSSVSMREKFWKRPLIFWSFSLTFKNAINFFFYPLKNWFKVSKDVPLHEGSVLIMLFVKEVIGIKFMAENKS